MELFAIVVAGFLLALLVPALERLLGEAAPWVAALVPVGITVALARHLPAVAAGSSRIETYAWVPSLGAEVAFRLDGLSMALALLVTVVGTFVFVYAGRYLAGQRQRARVLALLAVFMAAMLGLLLADDALTLFVFWELTSLASYGLIATYHEEPESRKAAQTALVVTAGGGLALLAGLILLGQAAGTLRLSSIAASAELVQASPTYPLVVGLVLAGALTKSAQAPVSFWLPSAMKAPAPVSAYLHSATMVNAGVYLLLRLTPALGGTGAWSVPLVTLGGFTMVAGGVLALFQKDLKLVLAHSTVSVLGTLTMLTGLGSAAAIKAAIVLLIAHGLYKSSLFMLAGAIDHETGTRDLDRLSGLRTPMPTTAAIAGLAALSLAGLGPLLSFVGKELFFEALLEALSARPLLLVAGTLTAMALIGVAGIVGLRPFLGEPSPAAQDAHEPPVAMRIGPAVLALLGIAMGISSPWLGPALVGPAARSVLSEATAVKLDLWHGPTPALFLTLISLVGGFVVYREWLSLHRLLPRLERYKAWTPGGIYPITMDRFQEASRRLTAWTADRSVLHHVGIVLAGFVLLAAATLAPTLGSLAPVVGPVLPVQLALGLLIAIAAILVATTGSRLVSVVGLGVVGYAIAVLFTVFGAPDLAITQFLVETLAAVLFLYVLARLPRYETRMGGPGRLAAGLLSLAVGLAVFGLLALASGPPTDLVSGYYRAQSYAAAHGRNVVNVVLADFRALDTFGEVTVLAVAALGVRTLLRGVGQEGSS